MGEISFNYDINTEPIHESAFKYWFSELIEYGFAYQRYVAFSDASIFNSPVAITKVATGLYQLYDLFVDKKAHPIMYDLIKNFDKIPHDTDKSSETFADFHKERKKTIEHQVHSFVYRPNLFQSDVYTDDYYLHRDNPTLNKYENPMLSTDIKTILRNSKIRWLLDTHSMNIYENPILEKLYENEAAIYRNIYHLNRTMHLDILNTSHMGATFDNQMSIYEAFLITPPDIHGNIYEVFSTASFRIGMNVFDTVLMDEAHSIDLNTLNTYFGQRHELKLNVIPQIFLKYPYVLQGNVVKHFFGKESSSFDVNVDDTVSGTTPNEIINSNYILLGKKPNEHIDCWDSISGYRYGRLSHGFNSELVYKKHASLHDIEDIKALFSPSDKVVFYQQYSMYLYDKPVCYLDFDTFLIHESRHCFTLDNIVATITPQDMGIQNPLYQSSKTHGNVFMTNNEWMTIESDKIMTTEIVGQIKGNHGVRQSDIQSGVKNNRRIRKPGKIVSSVLQKKDFDLFYSSLFIDKNIKHLDNLSTGIFNDKYRKSLSSLAKCVFIDKDSHSFVVNDTMQETHKDNKSFLVSDSSVFIFKDKKSMNLDTLKFTPVFKDSSSMEIKDTVVGAKKGSHSFSLYTDLWISKDSHSMSLFEQWSLDKDNHSIEIFRQGHAFIKSLITVSAPEFDFVIKYHIPTDYINTLHNNYSGMIIPLSKIRHQAYIDRINNMVQKVSQKGYINQNLSASAIPKSTCVSSVDLFCDKEEFKTYIDYRNTHVSKNQVQGFILKNDFAKKGRFLTHLEGSIWADKILAKTSLDKQDWFQKKANRGQIEGITSATLSLKDVRCHNSLFVDKTERMCYYDYGITWADKNLEAQIHTQLNMVDKKQQELHMLDCVSPITRKQLNAFYDYGIFSSKIIHESNLFKQISDVHKIAHDTGIRPDDFGNWVWVYETPDPFNSLNFGIDELLLPEVDTRYEDFEDIIFDKQHMRPRNPVKQIDENTFIAKYPVKHPLPKYSDIGIDYDKSAVKIENFYGIETNIMQVIFLKFYRIWQNKIFEFGTMSMVQSVKLMLEYIYAWIMEYFPVEELEQALRVFRLIRWYGETSIIQNSQYIVSYEYDTLESKLNTGTCLVPNNLDVNDTMYVDSRLGVIRNNPIYINDRQTDAYVVFEIDNKKNTTFTFSLSNTVGSVNIYINDTLIDVVSRSALNLTYELPYTGDTNIIKIEKPAAHNLNGTFYIGNIKVPNCTFKDLSIEFDPTIKAGNKPLNEVAKKMIAYANLHDNRDEAYETLRKGNLGVEEIYKKLTEYWELHHQNKTKGKRLTIKEV